MRVLTALAIAGLVALGSASADAQTLRLVVPLDRPLAVPRLDGRAAAEAGAVVLTGVGHLAASRAGVSGAYIPVVVAGWEGYLTRHLDGAGLPAVAVVPASAAAFGSVHVPNWELTAATTAMGAAFAPLYLRDGTLWPLGVAHGALGALFYVWVLDRDPWAEIAGGD